MVIGKHPWSNRFLRKSWARPKSRPEFQCGLHVLFFQSHHQRMSAYRHSPTRSYCFRGETRLNSSRPDGLIDHQTRRDLLAIWKRHVRGTLFLWHSGGFRDLGWIHPCVIAIIIIIIIIIIITIIKHSLKWLEWLDQTLVEKKQTLEFQGSMSSMSSMSWSKREGASLQGTFGSLSAEAAIGSWGTSGGELNLFDVGGESSVTAEVSQTHTNSLMGLKQLLVVELDKIYQGIFLSRNWL